MKNALELTVLWQRSEDMFMSAVIMDDRVQDLLAMLQDGPIRLIVQRNPQKKNTKSPDMFVNAIPWRSKRREK